MSSAGKHAIPDPATWFGFQPGIDRRLIRWHDMLDYFQLLSCHSDRLQYEQLGTVSGDKPFVLLTVSAPDNLARIDEYRAIQQQLADPRCLDSNDAETLIEQGRTVLLLTCSIHATEVGSSQMVPELVYELVTGADPKTASILENVILLIVPSLNPWGLECVADWYEETLRTAAEGTSPPELYHPYTGHDNNRDWFMLTQVENRITVEKIHNVWHPHIVYDQHQMMIDGPRFVLPPYIDPYDPNIDPIMQAEIAQLGHSMAADLIAEGKTGVATQVIFDAWSPSRAYQHYHGGVRILSEAASCRIATPVELDPVEIRSVRGFDPLARRANNPAPWEGGIWGLRDIVEYNKSAAWACLRNAATRRESWVRNFYRIQLAALDVDEPFAWLIPDDQDDPGTAEELCTVLEHGLVEIHIASEDFFADGIMYPAGTKIVFAAQPFGRYARTLLSPQVYPDLRTDAGRPPEPPYDIAAHTLPLYFGIETIPVVQPFDVEVVPFAPEQDVSPPTQICEDTTATHWLLDPRRNKTFQTVTQLLHDEVPLSRTRTCFELADEELPAGTFVVESNDPERLSLITQTPGAIPIPQSHIPQDRASVRMPRIGLYRSWCPTAIDEGWTRFILEEYGFPFTTLRDQDIRRGGLRRHVDVIVLPHQGINELLHGNSALEYPAHVAGGLGERGTANLRRFVMSGGILITLDGTSEFAMRHLSPPIINPIATLTDREFYAPGSLLAMRVDIEHPIGWGMPENITGLLTGKHVFNPINEDDVQVVVRFPAGGLLRSGWILGADRISNNAAIVDVPIDHGRVILFGFRPQFRAQTRGTYRLFFNALLYGGMNLH